MKNYLSKIKIYNNKGKDISNIVKVFQLYIVNINSLLQLYSYIQMTEPNVKYILTRCLNQDSLEHFFGQIRSINGNAFNPTPIQFYFSFRKIFAVQYSSIHTGNCRADKDRYLITLSEFRQHWFVQDPVEEEFLLDTYCIDDHDYRDLELTEQNALRYICGYLIRKCLARHSCRICMQYANDNAIFDLNTVYCLHRAYNCTEDNPFGDLFMPNNNFIQYITLLEKLFFEHIHNLILQKGVLAKLLTILKQIRLNHPCEQFPTEYLVKLYCRVSLYYTLKFVNRRFRTQQGKRKIVILQHL